MIELEGEKIRKIAERTTKISATYTVSPNKHGNSVTILN